MKEFDFDYMMELQQDDPQRFEQERMKLINELIESIPDEKQHKMRCLQWRVDQCRRKSKNSLSSCMVITEMMWKSFEELNTLFMDMKYDKTPVLKTNNVIQLSER